jgi:hypothetical protein
MHDEVQKSLSDVEQLEVMKFLTHIDTQGQR